MQRYVRQDHLSSLLQLIYVKKHIDACQKVLHNTKLYILQSKSSNFNDD